jgi:uncharacterized repeat protein (TIGR03806 family)
MKKRNFIFLFVCFIAVSNIAFRSGVSDFVFHPKQKLSEYNFFTGNIAALQPAAGVVPYDLNTPLFSNYAEKLRFIKLPEGSKAVYTENGPLGFPIGTIVIKNFYYPHDFRNPGRGRRVMETRLLVNEEGGWAAYPYIWNNEQNDAVYDVAGDIKDISYISENGKKINIHYIIPNKNQCKGCHSSGDRMVLLGPTAGQLNSDYSYSNGRQNQLLYWRQQNMIAGVPDADKIPKLPDWDDRSQPTEGRARAYLDVNCGNCHHPLGPANTSGLFLGFNQTPSVELGIMKSPVAAGRGAGKNLFDIVPGKPHKSILTYRMQVNDPGVAMPELGREQIHKEGVELIAAWIKEMKNQ